MILAGGKGTRLSEETILKPKPMVQIGDAPILVHIMDRYYHYGFKDFIICLGYKGEQIKEYFASHTNLSGSIQIDFQKNEITKISSEKKRDWRIRLIETGMETMTGGRLKKAMPFIDNEIFFMTYGDGLSDIDFQAQLRFYNDKNLEALITAVRPPARFGALEFQQGDQDMISSFVEKPVGDGAWINGGFFILNKKIKRLLTNDETVFEENPLRELALRNELCAWRHEGFWWAMDTLRDKNTLQNLWESETCPWIAR